jgi:predicted KAP-like P-loop ATPase
VDLPAALIAQLDTADRLTTIMTTAHGIAGNPRLIKRFLNALSVRMAVASGQGITVDEAALAKLLLFERLAPPELYKELATDITNAPDGKPHVLQDWESPAIPAPEPAAPAVKKAKKDGHADDAAGRGDGPVAEDLPAPRPDRWSTPFVTDWLSLPPRLAEIDMRGALYVSREHLPIIHTEDGLSAAGNELFQALATHPTEAVMLTEQLATLDPAEIGRIFNRLLDIARKEEAWGVPTIFEALLVLTRVSPPLGGSLAGFLGQRPPSQIQPDLIPRIADEEWAPALLTQWADHTDVQGPVKVAIKVRTPDGDITK